RGRPVACGAGGSGAGGWDGVLVAFPRRRPAAKIATSTATTPIPIRTQPHHGRPPPLDSGAVVVPFTARAFTEVEWLTETDAAGPVTDFVAVLVLVLAGAEDVCVSVL